MQVAMVYRLAIWTRKLNLQERSYQGFNDVSRSLQLLKDRHGVHGTNGFDGWPVSILLVSGSDYPVGTFLL